MRLFQPGIRLSLFLIIKTTTANLQMNGTVVEWGLALGIDLELGTVALLLSRHLYIDLNQLNPFQLKNIKILKCKILFVFGIFTITDFCTSLANSHSWFVRHTCSIARRSFCITVHRDAMQHISTKNLLSKHLNTS